MKCCQVDRPTDHFVPFRCFRHSEKGVMDGLCR